MGARFTVVGSSPAVSSWSGMLPTVVGARFGVVAGWTPTWNVWVAERPPGSLAVMVTVAVPAATGVRVSTLPDTLTRTTAVSLDPAR